MLLGTVLGATVGGAVGWHAAVEFRLLRLPGMDVLGLSGVFAVRPHNQPQSTVCSTRPRALASSIDCAAHACPAQCDPPRHGAATGGRDVSTGGERGAGIGAPVWAYTESCR